MAASASVSAGTQAANLRLNATGRRLLRHDHRSFDERLTAMCRRARADGWSVMTGVWSGFSADVVRHVAFEELAVFPAFAAHKCGLLFAREAALGGNFGNDLTTDVLAAFDAKGTPITVELAPAETP